MQIRTAQAVDQPTITRLIHLVGINPMNLEWQRFVIAEDEGEVVGVGQIKPHDDGSRELASIAVIPERQGQGIGSHIIRTLLARESDQVYLMCGDGLETYYTRFGFRRIERANMSPYYKKASRAVNIFLKIIHSSRRVIVMKREKIGYLIQ